MFFNRPFTIKLEENNPPGEGGGGGGGGGGAPAVVTTTNNTTNQPVLAPAPAPKTPPAATPVGTAPPETPPAPAAPLPPTEGATGDQPQGEQHTWLKPRLEKAEKKGAEAKQKEFLAKFGVKSLKELEEQYNAGRQAVQAGLTEQERITQELERLKPLAESAETYKTAYERRLNADFEALDEHIREAIDIVAEGDPFMREKQMASFRAAGVIGQAAHAVVPPPAGGGEAGNGGAGTPPVQRVALPATTDNTPPPPPAGGAQSMYEKWQAIENPAQKQIFYRAHARAIEASTPP